MSVASGAVEDEQGLGTDLISTPEWLSLSIRQHNAIFEGPEHATESLLLFLQPSLRMPAIWKRAPEPFELPSDECGALVLRNVGALGRREQAALSRWLEASRKQVVATTVDPLFPLVAQGLFDEALYYRLNTVLMRIS